MFSKNPSDSKAIILSSSWCEETEGTQPLFLWQWHSHLQCWKHKDPACHLINFQSTALTPRKHESSTMPH